MMVKVLVKALKLLEVLAESEHGERVTDLHRTLNLDKATIHRLLSTLATGGYVMQNQTTGRYELSLKLWYLGSQMVGRRTLAQSARPIIKALSDASHQTVYLSLLIGHEAVIFEKVEVERPYRAPPSVGAALPLYASASGKAILAYREEEFMELITADLAPLTANTIIDPAQLKEDMKQTRQRGYAVNRQELRLGVSGIGAPVRGIDGQVTASLAMSGVTEDIEPNLERWAKQLVSAANELSFSIGSGTSAK